MQTWQNSVVGQRSRSPKILVRPLSGLQRKSTGVKSEVPFYGHHFSKSVLASSCQGLGFGVKSGLFRRLVKSMHCETKLSKIKFQLC